MKKRFGVPYKGSKNRIAEQIIEALPEADTFVDLFAGGCAVTHAAIESGKYKNFIVNDLDGRGVRLFEKAVNGEYNTLPDKWVSREDFIKNKELPISEQDPYIAICWSFGNNMKDYLYSKDIEDWKHAYHEAVFHNDLTLWNEMGFFPPECDETDIQKRRLFFGKVIRDKGGSCQDSRIQHAERDLSSMGGKECKPFGVCRKRIGTLTGRLCFQFALMKMWISLIRA